MKYEKRVSSRLGVTVTDYDGTYLIDKASGSLVVRRIAPINQPSAIEASYCGVCGDTPPVGAKCCITCGVPVAATGRTERL